MDNYITAEISPMMLDQSDKSFITRSTWLIPVCDYGKGELKLYDLYGKPSVHAVTTSAHGIGCIVYKQAAAYILTTDNLSVKGFMINLDMLSDVVKSPVIDMSKYAAEFNSELMQIESSIILTGVVTHRSHLLNNIMLISSIDLETVRNEAESVYNFILSESIVNNMSITVDPISKYLTHKKKVIVPVDGYIHCNSKFALQSIPGYIMKMLRRPGSNIDELSKVLKLDPNTTYWSYKDIPLICDHVWMLLNNVEPKSVSKKYASDGCCIICDSAIGEYAEDADTTLSLEVYKMVITFLKLANCNDKGAIRWLSTTLYTFASSQLKSTTTNRNNIFNVCVMACLCAVYDKLKLDGVTLKPIKSLVPTINVLIGNIRWTDQQFKLLSAKLSEKQELLNIATTLKSKLMSMTKVIPDEELISSLTINTPMNKAWREDSDELNKLYGAYESKRDLDWSENTRQPHLESVIKANKGKAVKERIITFTAAEVYNKQSPWALCWDTIWNFICPVNDTHEFGKETCKHCGIDKDGENKWKVFDKYAYNLFRPVDLGVSRIMIAKDVLCHVETVKEICAIDETKYNTLVKIPKVIIPEGKETLMTQSIAAISNIPVDVINKTVRKYEDLCKLYKQTMVWAITNKKLTSVEVLTELYTMFINPEDVSKIFIRGYVTITEEDYDIAD